MVPSFGESSQYGGLTQFCAGKLYAEDSERSPVPIVDLRSASCSSGQFVCKVVQQHAHGWFSWPSHGFSAGYVLLHLNLDIGWLKSERYAAIHNIDVLTWHQMRGDTRGLLDQYRILLLRLQARTVAVVDTTYGFLSQGRCTQWAPDSYPSLEYTDSTRDHSNHFLETTDAIHRSFHDFKAPALSFCAGIVSKSPAKKRCFISPAAPRWCSCHRLDPLEGSKILSFLRILLFSLGIF